MVDIRVVCRADNAGHVSATEGGEVDGGLWAAKSDELVGELCSLNISQRVRAIVDTWVIRESIATRVVDRQRVRPVECCSGRSCLLPNFRSFFRWKCFLSL